LAEASRSVAAVSSHRGSSGMILAMHHLQVAATARQDTPAMHQRLCPLLVRGELLLANANSEVGAPGEGRVSTRGLEPGGGGVRLAELGVQLHLRRVVVAGGANGRSS